jgi:hypothetical protein
MINLHPIIKDRLNSHQNFQGKLLVGVRRHPAGELHPSMVPQHIIYVGVETKVVECLIVEVDVGHKPLLKTREFLLLLLRQYDEAI